MYSHNLKCGNCNNVVGFWFEEVGDFTPVSPERLKLLSVRHEDQITLAARIKLGIDIDEIAIQGFAKSQCPICYHPALIIYHCTRTVQDALKIASKTNDFGHLDECTSSLVVNCVYPTPKEAEQDPLWPDTVRRKFADTQDCLAEGKDAAFILMMCRTVLELALRELDAGRGDTSLFKRIDLLHGSGVITSPIRDWAHAIRLDGNSATHEGHGDANAASQYVEFLKMFFNMVFSLPARIEKKRADVKADAQADFDRRV